MAGAYQHYVLFGKDEGRKPNGADSDKAAAQFRAMRDVHGGEHYLTPGDLAVTRVSANRILLIGSCFLEPIAGHASDALDGTRDFWLANFHAKLPDAMPHPASDYDLIVLQIPFRGLLPANAIWSLDYDDEASHHRVFEHACRMIDDYVAENLKWTLAHGIPTLVCNLMVPQSDLTGRLLPRYDLRNTMYFVEELNRHIGRAIQQYANVYLLDVDKVSASLGRRYAQDDGVFWFTHSSLMPMGSDQDVRIEPMAHVYEHYHTDLPKFMSALWQEIAASYRTLRAADAVKLVVVDLDDTLWRGVSGDDAVIGPEMIEGWPLGIIETLMHLKKRGVMLGIISKNDEARIRSIWPRIFGSHMSLDDFAVVRINWTPKSENMAAILRAVNVLPHSVVYVDDNPVERAEMAHAYPGIRVLGRYPFYLRRTLAWAPETQVASITDESGRRTQMIQSQVVREEARATLPRSVFLATLEIEVSVFPVPYGSARFARAFELINKTNQFNTTGRRWSADAIKAAMDAGMTLDAFEVRDRLTSYGLVGVCLRSRRNIDQFVMSCRVNGLDVEMAALATILAAIPGDEVVTATFKETPSNLLCRDFWSRCGFTMAGDEWRLHPQNRPSIPAFIRVANTSR